MVGVGHDSLQETAPYCDGVEAWPPPTKGDALDQVCVSLPMHCCKAHAHTRPSHYPRSLLSPPKLTAGLRLTSFHLMFSCFHVFIFSVLLPFAIPFNCSCLIPQLVPRGLQCGVLWSTRDSAKIGNKPRSFLLPLLLGTVLRERTTITFITSKS